MKQVVVESYCDLHPEPGQVPATDEVTFEGRLLDVCAEHKVVVDDAIKALADLFASGVPVNQIAKAPTPRKKVGRPAQELKESEAWRTCPECKYVTPTRSALGQHVKQQHGKVLGDFDWST